MTNTAAIIVTYNPDLENLTTLVKSLVSDGIPCFIVDNDSDCELSSLSNIPELTIVNLESNEGIAKAQNIGINKCFLGGFERIIFFDQDSFIEAGFISTLLSTLNDQNVKIAAPVFYDRAKGYGYKIVDIDARGGRKIIRPEGMGAKIDVSVAISSGTVVDVAVFKKVGLMNEALFIDYVDTEWCLRCRDSGYLVKINPDAKMLHSIGDRSISFFGFNIPVHSPTRRYYRVRNAFLMLRLSHIPKLLVLREIFFGLAHQVIITFNADSKLEYLKYYLKGCWDGILGRGGRVT